MTRITFQGSSHQSPISIKNSPAASPSPPTAARPSTSGNGAATARPRQPLRYTGISRASASPPAASAGGQKPVSASAAQPAPARSEPVSEAKTGSAAQAQAATRTASAAAAGTSAGNKGLRLGRYIPWSRAKVSHTKTEHGPSLMCVYYVS